MARCTFARCAQEHEHEHERLRCMRAVAAPRTLVWCNFSPLEGGREVPLLNTAWPSVAAAEAGGGGRGAGLDAAQVRWLWLRDLHGLRCGAEC